MVVRITVVPITVVPITVVPITVVPITVVLSQLSLSQFFMAITLIFFEKPVTWNFDRCDRFNTAVRILVFYVVQVEQFLIFY